MTTLFEPLPQLRSAVRDELRAVLDRLDDGTRHACGYQLGFWDIDGTPCSAEGKGVRPALALLSGQAAGARGDDAVPAAVACELVHNFSLLHDDVMDGDRERRHRPTVWAAFGVPTAILAGDALLSLACERLAEAPSPTVSWAIRCLSATTRRLIAGQRVDLAFETRDDVTLEECLRMEADKTGALLACSASLGAVLVDAPAALALGLAEFGERVGLAFQLVDDLLGIWGEPQVTGKPVLSDLRSRKKTAPVVAAMQSGTPAGDRLKAFYHRPDPLNEHELVDVAELVEAAGGRRWAETRADDELAAALAGLGSLDLADDVAEALTSLAERLSRRDH